MYRKDERVQEARQRQRKCCFCIHLRPGVFILLFLHVLLSIALFSITGFFLINVSWLFISNLVLYSIFAIGFFLGVMGVLNVSIN
ncbi:hypothetical protein HMI54_005926 [Coelomomyces lativittatus]|nr:hypothetical protein HMI54_005926 [Coelomomyces lativittatus]